MPFVHTPIFWLGLGCVSLPVIIHLLNRRRFRIRPWAAMQFLLESLRRNRRRLRIEELILLALRCLAILALAIALARLLARTDLPGSTESHTSVFVLDDSYSMGQKVASASIFRAAADDLVDQIKKLHGKSKVAVLLASASQADPPLFSLDLAENLDPDDLKRRVDSLLPSDKRVSPANVLAKAARIFEGKKGAKRLWLLGDFRATDLQSAGQARALREQFKALTDAGVELVALDYGREPHDNLTIESITLLDRFAVANSEIRIAVTVRNNSPRGASRVRLTGSVRFVGSASADGPDPGPAAVAPGEADTATPLAEQTISSISPGEAETAVFRMKPATSGTAVISVALGDDELDGDNRAHLVTTVRPALRALVVDGRPDSTDPEESESWPYRNALDPNGNGDRGVMAKVVDVDDLGAEDLSEYDVVTLLDVGRLPAVTSRDRKREVFLTLQRLERYVRDGGGLVIYTGQSVNTGFYNGPLHAGGLGLSPYSLSEPLYSPEQEFFRLDPKSVRGEGPMEHFHGVWAFNTDLVRFTAITPADESTGKSVAGDVMPARILARFTNGDRSPAVAIRQFGKGAVVMVYTAAGNMKWSRWTKEGAIYVPAVLDTAFYVARSQIGRAGKQVGRPIVHPLSSRTSALGSLKTPDYPQAPTVALSPQDGFTPSARESLGVLADRMAQLGAPGGTARAEPAAGIAALARAAENVRKALADDNLAAMEEALKQAQEAIKDAPQRNTPAGSLRAEITNRLDAGLGELFGRELRFERTGRSGIYELTVPAAGGRTVFFARNPDPLEGNLAYNGREDLVAAIGEPKDPIPWTYRKRSAAAASADISATTDAREYWLWAMGALLGLLAVEIFLAQRFGHYDLKK